MFLKLNAKVNFLLTEDGYFAIFRKTNPSYRHEKIEFFELMTTLIKNFKHHACIQINNCIATVEKECFFYGSKRTKCLKTLSTITCGRKRAIVYKVCLLFKFLIKSDQHSIAGSLIQTNFYKTRYCVNSKSFTFKVSKGL